MANTAAQRFESLAAATPVHPVLFAVYPVLRLYEENLVDIQPGELVLPLVIAAAGAMLGLAILALLMHDTRRAALIVSVVILPAMSFGLLYEVAQPILGDQRLLLLVACVVAIAAVAVVALRIGDRLGSVTLGLNVISLILVLLTLVPTARSVAAFLGDGPGAEPAVAANAGATIGPQRDIYHFVFDRYGSQQALQAGFGIDNAAFVAWLRDQGFQVVDDAWANYAKTTLSMSATLGMSPLDELSAILGAESANLGPVIRRIQTNPAGAFLQDHGYDYIHIGSWYGPTRDSSIADRVFGPDVNVSLASTLFDLSVLPVLVDLPGPEDDFRRRHADAARYQFDLLDQIIKGSDRKYVLAHILVPHPPYVFLEDGTYAPEEATFQTQLDDTNRRIKAMLEPLLALPEDERPIIIIQADEGPFPDRLDADENGFDWATATDAELVTKFGILDAMYLPGPEGEAPLPSHMTAINTYPEIFRRYFGTAAENQPDRIFASSKVTPYDMLEITERLAAASEQQERPAATTRPG